MKIELALRQKFHSYRGLFSGGSDLFLNYFHRFRAASGVRIGGCKSDNLLSIR